MKRAFRCAVLGKDLRVDGRQFDEVRNIKAIADVLPISSRQQLFRERRYACVRNGHAGAIARR